MGTLPSNQFHINCDLQINTFQKGQRLSKLNNGHEFGKLEAFLLSNCLLHHIFILYIYITGLYVFVVATVLCARSSCCYCDNLCLYPLRVCCSRQQTTLHFTE